MRTHQSQRQPRSGGADGQKSGRRTERLESEAEAGKEKDTVTQRGTDENRVRETGRDRGRDQNQRWKTDDQRDGKDSSRVRERRPWAAGPPGCTSVSECWPAMRGLSGMGGKSPTEGQVHPPDIPHLPNFHPSLTCTSVSWFPTSCPSSGNLPLLISPLLSCGLNLFL